LLPLRWSLKRTALILLLPSLFSIGAAGLWRHYRTLADAANSAYDRSLLGAIKSIDANISTEAGGLAVELPYTMLEFFELTAAGEVIFRVASEDGLVEVGSADIPAPPAPLVTRVPQFYDSVYFGEKVRVGAYARQLDRPTAAGGHDSDRVVIQVAESLASRSDFIHSLLLQSVARDLLLLLVAGGLLTAVLALTLRPLARLRDEVGSRSPLDLTPIEAETVPLDVRPLVEAINLHMARSQQIMEERRRFVDDASHQLRTPLATLRTQLDYALRESDPANVRHALEAVSRQVDDAVRSTNQMLALAKADAAELDMAEVDLAALAEQVAREWVGAAREKRIDLEFDAPVGKLPVRGHAGLLGEAAANLVSNAIRFAPPCGSVALKLAQADGCALLCVTDDGPGIPPDQLPRMGERFFRARNTSAGGFGLGLAIARAVAVRHGGQLRIDNLAAGGCIATLSLPLALIGTLPGALPGALSDD
jgi:two-component system sensor histidine kinase TctE